MNTLPNRILLDVSHEAKLVREGGEEMEDCELCLSEIIERTLSYISEEDSAAYGVTLLINEVFDEHVKHGHNRDGAIARDVTKHVANYLHKELAHHQLYNEHGELEYVFEGFLDDNRTIVLGKGNPNTLDDINILT